VAVATGVDVEVAPVGVGGWMVNVALGEGEVIALGV
jgi:hypothetical protein